MQLARVIGDVVCTMKDAELESLKLVVLQPVGADGADAGRALVALDSCGAGVGERVFFVKGKEATFPFYPALPPADACVVGIIDDIDVPESRDRL
ncbi:MAG: EutN/CcmL family microcompartment protein [Acidobacteriota bacterium]|nr:EutN/CcmL family microcompartment protein [Acidobacteriota bacterium]